LLLGRRVPGFIPDPIVVKNPDVNGLAD
jgi:hypothetical protein